MQALLSSHVDGLIAARARATQDSEHFLRLHPKGLAWYSLTASLPPAGVLAEDCEGAFTALEHLISVGYRRIAHLKGSPSPEQKRAGRITTGPLVCFHVQFPSTFADDADESWVDKGGGIGVAGLVESGTATTGGASSWSCTRMGS